jgi:8-oxo-dGTP diphosphatase
VHAAGGLVCRVATGGRPEVLLVHRADRADWTFPKGKRRPDEADAACARREVEEETGLRCALGAELPPTTYVTRSGRLKRVRYWAMRPVAGTAAPRSEIDAVRWVGLRAAALLLTYARDRAVLAAFARGLRERPAAARRRRTGSRAGTARGTGVSHAPSARAPGLGRAGRAGRAGVVDSRRAGP